LFSAAASIKKRSNPSAVNTIFKSAAKKKALKI
jgi:hypothetical protein